MRLTKEKRKTRLYLPYLFLAIISFGLLTLLINGLSPNEALKAKFVNFPALVLFFALIFLSFFFLGTFIFRRKLQGAILSLFVFFYLILRINGINQIFFLFLITGLFIVVGLLTTKKK